MFKRAADPAFLVAFLALFVSLSGGAIAAKLVDGRAIKKGTVDITKLSASTQALLRKASQAGPQGAPGAKGSTGATGATGAAGTNGANGETGPAGAKGDTGAKGDSGSQGIQGIQGAKGDPGAKGDIGDRGPQGLPGGTGPSGQDGQQGPTGLTGPQGDPGPTGDRGPQGDPGPTGDRGPQGDPGDTIGDAKAEYGVAKVYLHRGGSFTPIGTLWTSDIPDDGNNAAQASATLPIPAQAGDVIEVYGAVRSEETDAGGHMGAALTLTSASGGLLGVDQTAPAPGGDERGTTRTVAAPRLALTSDGPTTTTGALLASVTVPVNGTVVASGVVQAFDFND